MRIVDHLTPDELGTARALTFRTYHPLLDTTDGIAILALVDGGEAIGLALWKTGLGRDGTMARLLSLMIRADYRRQGLGTRLLATSIERLAPDTETILSFWSSNLPGAAAFEALLVKAGWGDKVLDHCRVSGTAKTARDWAHRRRMDRMLTRPGLSFSSYEDLSPHEIETINDAVAAAEVPETWRPFARVEVPDTVIPALSIIMRQDGRVAGWLTTCTRDGSEIWYYRLYNLAAARGAGALMPLIVEVNRRHFLRDGPDARWRWNTGSERPYMLAFLARHASEFCDFHDYFWTASKTLKTKSDRAVGEAEQLGTVA